MHELTKFEKKLLLSLMGEAIFWMLIEKYDHPSNYFIQIIGLGSSILLIIKYFLPNMGTLLKIIINFNRV